MLAFVIGKHHLPIEIHFSGAKSLYFPLLARRKGA